MLKLLPCLKTVDFVPGVLNFAPPAADFSPTKTCQFLQLIPDHVLSIFTNTISLAYLSR